MTSGPYTSGPTDPGGDPPFGCQHEYDRGFNHGFIAGTRSCASGGGVHVCPPGKSCCGEAPLTRLFLGLAAGSLFGLLLGLFIGLFVANVLGV